MKRDLGLWQFGGFVTATLGGTILHFLYDWTGESAAVAPFAAVNESTWEHTKLLVLPMLLFALFQYRAFREDGRFWCIKLRGTLIGLTLIPVLFYTISGAFGVTPGWVNIALFFVAAAIAYLIEYRLFQRRSVRCRHPKLALAALVAILLPFAVFTFFPPRLPLFLDPVTGTYGI